MFILICCHFSSNRQNVSFEIRVTEVLMEKTNKKNILIVFQRNITEDISLPTEKQSFTQMKKTKDQRIRYDLLDQKSVAFYDLFWNLGFFFVCVCVFCCSLPPLPVPSKMQTG